MSDQTVFVGRTKRVTPLTDAELNYSPEEWAEALAEDPSCIRAYLEAAEERGRRAGIEERDGLRALLREVRPLVMVMFEESGALPDRTWKAFLARMDAALAPRDSGKDTVLVLHPAQDGTCMYCHVAHFGICDAMNGQEDRK